jgi:hypothetical protein
VNLYAYVSNDPINWIDPLGLCQDLGVHTVDVTIVVTAPCPTEPPPSHEFGMGSGGFGGGGATGSWGGEGGAGVDDKGVIVVTATVPAKHAVVAAPPPNKIYFGYPSIGNNQRHALRHLYENSLTDRQVEKVKNLIQADIANKYPNLSPNQAATGL